jgi:hypothetical protein
MANPTATSEITPRQANDLARYAVISRSVQMEQPIKSVTVTTPGSDNNVLSFTPRNVGLHKGYIVEVTATANNTDAVNAATLTDFGVANVLTKVEFTDLNNNTRISTSGAHLYMVDTLKYRGLSGAAFDGSAYGHLTAGFGDNFAVVEAPATIAKEASGEIRCRYFVPLAYSDDDLRGAIFANVLNATMNLEVTINGKPFVAADKDSTYAIFKGATGNLSNVTVSVYQVYLDQLPRDTQGKLMLPMIDISTVYEFKQTAMSGMTEGQEFPVPYANFRDFLSTLIVYNNDASADAGRVGGTDITYFAMQSANFTNIFKDDPRRVAEKVRRLIGCDLPKGMYYFDHRRQPINSSMYGNMELILNPSTAAASAYLNVGWESLALTNVVKQAGSLAS